MNAKKSKIIENLLVAQAMILELPNSRFASDLNEFANDKMIEHGPNHCGSTACFGGWVALHPHFQAQGVRPDAHDGSPTFRNDASTMSVSETLFGDSYMFVGGTRFGYNNDVHNREKKEILARIKDALEYQLA